MRIFGPQSRAYLWVQPLPVTNIEDIGEGKREESPFNYFFIYSLGQGWSITAVEKFTPYGVSQPFKYRSKGASLCSSTLQWKGIF